MALQLQYQYGNTLVNCLVGMDKKLIKIQPYVPLHAFCFTGFIFDFVFPDLLLFCFFHVWREPWEILVLCIFVVVPCFANLWISSIFQKFSFWLVFVVSCLQVWWTAIYTLEPSD